MLTEAVALCSALELGQKIITDIKILFKDAYHGTK